MRSNLSTVISSMDDEDLSFLTDEELQEVLRYTHYQQPNNQLSQIKTICNELTAEPQTKNEEEDKKNFNENLRKLFPFLKQGCDETIELKKLLFPDNILSEDELKKVRRTNKLSTLIAVLETNRISHFSIVNAISESSAQNGYTGNKIQITNKFFRIIFTWKDNHTPERYIFLKEIRALKGKTTRLSPLRIREFTSSYTSLPPSIQRALQGKSDYHIRIVEETKNQKIKMLIHLPQLAKINCELLYEFRTTYLPLLTNIFDLYVCENGKITPFKRLDTIDPISTTDLKNLLNKQNQDLNDYYIFDYKELLDLYDNHADTTLNLQWNELLPFTLENIHFFKKTALFISKASDVDNSIFSDNKFISLISNSEDFTVSSDSSDISLFEIPKQNDNLKHIKIKLIGITDLQLDNASNLESIEFTYTNSIKFIDLSKLLKLESVTFTLCNLVIDEIKLNPETAKFIVFDFSTSSFTEKTYKAIISLRNQGAQVKLKDQDERELAERISGQRLRSSYQHFSRTFHAPELKSISSQTNAKKLSPENYLTNASPLQHSKEKHSIQGTQNLYGEEGPIDASHYRKTIYTGITMSFNTLRFTPYQFNESKSTSIDLTPIIKKGEINASTYKKTVAELNAENPRSFLGVIALSTSNSKWVPLKSLSLNDELVFLSQENIQKINSCGMKLDVRYAEETRQYFVKLTKIKNIPMNVPSSIDLFYGMSPTKKQTLSAQPLPAPIPAELKLALDHMKGLREALDAPTTQEKLDKITQFCTAFQDFNEEYIESALRDMKKHLTDAKIENTSIHEFMMHLNFQAGSCHHRSRAFMVLASYFGIPARVNANDTHEYVEYFLDGRWILNNTLGGSIPNEKILNNPWNDAFFQKKEGALVVQNQDIPLHLTPHQEEKTLSSLESIIPEETYDHLFNPDEIVLNESGEFKDWYLELKNLTGFPPLLQFNNTIDPLNLHSCLMNQPGVTVGENYFYIEHPDDFDHYLQLLQVKDNACNAIEGPLLKLFHQKEPGTLFVNWSNFTPKQIANYKSILDKNPTLQGYIIPPTIKIINASYPGTNACSAFHSRTQRVAWPTNSQTLSDLASHANVSIEGISETKETIIDLYESQNWEALLIGQPKISLDGFKFKEGKLLKALNKNKTDIYLTGIPHEDPSFHVFFERLKREKGFYANGKWISIPEKFTIHLLPNPKIDNTPIYPFFREIWPTQDQSVYFINKQTYESLFEQFTINKAGKANQHAGLLAKMHDQSTLVLTDSLNQGELRLLKRHLNKLKAQNPSITIHLTTLPHLAEIKTTQTPTLYPDTSLNSSTVILTSDVNSAARMVQATQKPTHTITISNKTEFSDLFENYKHHSEEKDGKKSLRFERSALELYKKLKAGETIILKGPISSELYHQLETLFAIPSYLLINGKQKIIPGKLILITPENKNLPDLFNSAPRYEHSFSWNTVPVYLKQKMNLKNQDAKDLTDRIQNFYQEAKAIKHNGKTTPPALNVTEDLVLQLAMAIQQNKGQANPIEHVFQQAYTEDPESYAKLTALAEKHLADIDEQKISVDLPEPLETKQARWVHQILELSPFIELRGSPGTGKTHFITHHLTSGTPFWGEDAIIQWLTADQTDPKQKQYLLLDEANMKEPGYWDFLKDLSTGEIYYKGKFYPVDPKVKKVIFTGNPENYPNRHYHEFLQHVPKVYFKSHTHDYLREHIIIPALQTIGLDEQTQGDVAEGFIFAYQQARKALPFECLGIRDVRSLIDQLKHSKPQNSADAKQQALLACQAVFSGLFKDPADKKQYLSSLTSYFNVARAPLRPLPDFPNKDYYVPESRQILWHQVNQCIEKGGLITPGSRRAILIEGPSGIGKTEMMLRALENQGFINHEKYDPRNPQKQKVFFHLTMGSENIHLQLQKAYELGKKIPVALVLDELNLLTPENEALLTAVLEGRSIDPISTKIKENTNNQEPEEKEERSNLVVLASQNSQLEAGRSMLSYALLNRFDRFYEEPYTREDYLNICAQSGKFNEPHQNAARFVDRFLKQHEKHPSNINARTFFETLQNLPSPIKKSHTSSSPENDAKLTKMGSAPIRQIKQTLHDFDEYLKVINAKRASLEKDAEISKGCHDAWIAMKALYDTAHTARQNVKDTSPETLESLKNTCLEAVRIAKQSELKNPRESHMDRYLSHLTIWGSKKNIKEKKLPAAETPASTETESIKKVNEFERRILSIKTGR